MLMLSPQRLVFGGGVMKNEALLHTIRATAATLGGYASIGTTAESLEQSSRSALGERSGLRRGNHVGKVSSEERQ
jgi:hypothetical protein